MAANLEDLERALVAADQAGNADDAKRLASAIVTMRSSQHAPVNALDEMGAGSKFLAGAGKSFADIGRSVRQMVGAGDQQEINDARKSDAALMGTGAGLAGNVTGTLAAALPTLAIPGANSVAGAAAIGGVMGALQPTIEGESRLRNVATGAALGGGAQYGVGKLAGALGNRLAGAETAGAAQASQNAVRDATMKGAQEAGYLLPPSQTGSGVLPRVLEGVSGKFKTNQAMAVKNQNVTNTLARRALGLADDAPLTSETMQAVRDNAFKQGYEPVTKAGAIETDRIFQKALDGIVDDFQGAARSFPDAVHPEVVKRIDSLRTGVMDTGDALKMTRILRDQANAAYVSGNNLLGKATKKAANAIEDQVERALQSAGKDGKELLENFRTARELMAKSHSVEKAIVEGGGVVNAKALGAALQRGKPLTGELKTIGAFANNFRDVAGVPQSGFASPITALDAFGAAGMAGMGAGPMAVALPAARMGARSLLTNPKFQQAAVRPHYGPGLLQKGSTKAIQDLERRGLLGLLGSIQFEQ